MTRNKRRETKFGVIKNVSNATRRCPCRGNKKTEKVKREQKKTDFERGENMAS